jgi:transcriptional regulator with XRE-family HTH domain
VLDPHTAIVAELVKLLVELRKQRGLSQETLASRARLSRAGIGHMESGRTTPTLLLLLKIAVLEVDLFDLLRQAVQRVAA